MNILKIKVVPNASKSEISGWLDDRLKIRIAVAPESGKANRAVQDLLAKTLGISKHQIKITAGLQSPRKTVEIEGLELAEIKKLLG
ncbi:hypothetical protein MNB_SUP05-5-252 [hydrothermal vent metagenome]|uniref:COG1872 n=1 Tax=hydrothermal vent metagenome TaxID=652676 RepID=A0A1W1C3X5_9ZZZZ